MRFGFGVIHAPDPPDDAAAWRAELRRWRESVRRELDLESRRYQRPEFAWTRSCYSCAMVMLWDEEFHDPAIRSFTVESYLRRGVEQFGGYDAVVLWHAYPRIGVDERNQFDFYRQVPGGLPGLRRLVDELHGHGVRVFLDYNPWDVGTRRELVGDAEALADLIATVDADGVFLDTMNQGRELRAAVDARRDGVVFEAEGHLPLEHLHDHHMSWGQWFDVGETAPAVLRNRWVERGHQHHLIHRWDRDHSDEVHAAWMNGAGVLVWENVFGTWNGWSERDRALLRAIVPLQRAFADLFTTGEWTPLVDTLADGVYASRWDGDDVRLWTVVNRSTDEATGPLLSLAAEPGLRSAELVSGRELPGDGDTVTLDGPLPPRGLACVVVADADAWARRVTPLLAASPDGAAPVARTIATATPSIGRLPVAPAAATSAPAAMAAVAGVERDLDVVFRLRECGTYEGAPVLDDHAPRFHHPVREVVHAVLGAYAIDAAPVTNAEFAAFVAATGYRPDDPGGFLRHWPDGGPAPGIEHLPVVNVDLADARAYARWAGRRLPTEHEWQHALETGAAGYGNARVWEWTESVHSDGHTRFCLLKGGADFTAYGSVWYVDGGPRPPQFTVKFILSWPELDRCSTVGFRCAVDLTPNES
ncbi:formylglycine-generating enzyme family protein [Jiangella asiatica]|uniref:Formylglycine-generating enzyme family protein n=1 Tax=Jiangella asiatica TaxID=2530372 RepID=A0A4R5D8K2_9ACTN|nr:formylglycine-generating enzyme family protein [Jiangella asiatica]TDE09892.1 formylglycine-generating enzyme family protein [Jiangella asiatica]